MTRILSWPIVSAVYRNIPSVGGRQEARRHYLEKAKAFEIQKKFDEALKAIDLAASYDPKNTDAHLLRGDCYTKKGDRKLAVVEYTAHLALNPKHLDALWARADHYFDQKNYAEALADYTAIYENDPKDALALYNIGFCHHYKKNYEQAVAGLTAAIEINPLNPDFYQLRALSYVELDKKLLAIIDYTRALELSPNNWRILLDRAATYSKNEIDLQIKDYSAVLRINPKHYDAYYFRACAYLKKAENLLALQDLVAFCLRQPKDHDGFVLRAKCFYRLGEMEAAWKDVSDVLNRDPTDISGLYRKGKLHQKTKEYDQAIQSYTAALDTENRYGILLERARCYVEKKEIQKALDDCEAALKIQPDCQKVLQLKASLKMTEE